jgi:hypothetical protein
MEENVFSRFSFVGMALFELDVIVECDEDESAIDG